MFIKILTGFPCFLIHVDVKSYYLFDFIWFHFLHLDTVDADKNAFKSYAKMWKTKDLLGKMWITLTWTVKKGFVSTGKSFWGDKSHHGSIFQGPHDPGNHSVVASNAGGGQEENNKRYKGR